MRVLFAFLVVLNFVVFAYAISENEIDTSKNGIKFELLKLGEFKDQNVSGWLFSEKLDGIRAYWDGKILRSRNGKTLNAPSEFTAEFPPFELDGELYLGRGEFERLTSVVMDKTPNLTQWSEVKFYVFDVPHEQGGLLKRLEKLKNFMVKNTSSAKHIRIIKQTLIKDNTQLLEILNEVERLGGEGVVVRHPDTPYHNGRSKNDLKIKSFKDAECEVIALNKGNGKYKNMLGSLECKDLKTAKKFKIGSGFSDKDRTNPPKIGEIITYKYQNLTANGVPRFPIFLRVRKD
ncbi:DNA ligase [Campylobacter sp. faydin G-24]|uniref:DNA ligase n=1 Tax=Campylobacter anatolicus TaxID=2829105 RepID=A0ABS5HGN5_9BACT|nr:DNA ligase [Campylobacter anatolicus]MBR8463433.1 DNA ligase [Campylobacter anatolicus]